MIGLAGLLLGVALLNIGLITSAFSIYMVHNPYFVLGLIVAITGGVLMIIGIVTLEFMTST